MAEGRGEVRKSAPPCSSSQPRDNARQFFEQINHEVRPLLRRRGFQHSGRRDAGERKDGLQAHSPADADVRIQAVTDHHGLLRTARGQAQDLLQRVRLRFADGDRRNADGVLERGDHAAAPGDLLAFLHRVHRGLCS